MPTQGVSNVWEQSKVQNLDIFGLQWTLAPCVFFIQCPFLMNFLGKVVHASLVSIDKISLSIQNTLSDWEAF